MVISFTSSSIEFVAAPKIFALRTKVKYGNNNTIPSHSRHWAQETYWTKLSRNILGVQFNPRLDVKDCWKKYIGSNPGALLPLWSCSTNYSIWDKQKWETTIQFFQWQSVQWAETLQYSRTSCFYLTKSKRWRACHLSPVWKDSIKLSQHMLRASEQNYASCLVPGWTITQHVDSCVLFY